MSKLSESDIIESIFAIVVGVIVSRGRVDMSDVNAARTLVEPFLFSSGKYEGSLAKDAKREKGSNPPDFFNVNLTIEIPIKDSDDEKYTMAYRSSSDIGDLRDKVDRLILQATPIRSPALAKILKARDNFLDNTDQQTITFDVFANGGGGDNSVKVVMEVQTDEGPNKILDERIPFDFKVEPEEEKNLKTYNNILAMSNKLNLKWKDVSKYSVISNFAAKSSYEKRRKFEILQMMANELFKIASQYKVDVSNRAMSFVNEALYGGTLGIIVASEPDAEAYETFQSTAKLNIFSSADSLVFKDTKTYANVFTLKMRPRPTTGQIDFVLETNKAYFDKMKKK